jgi:hypothetical protein
MTPNKTKCHICGKRLHEDIYEACTKCYGTFKATKNGLVEVKDKPIKVTINGKTTIVNPDNPFYNTVSYYSKSVEYDVEDKEDHGVPSLSEN